ncbi:hypothetical protein GW17_00010324 [Ensete ventricosum]|nr:hypothetical protein GW17_00010324 [Ensete ventricosum]RZR83457.1 hypothetical protein BHM03_00010077 [Ensete ventricosum]
MIGLTIAEGRSSGTTGLMVAEGCNSGTIGLTVVEGRSSGTTGLMVAEGYSSGTTGLMVSEGRNSGTIWLMVAEGCNSGTIGMMVVEGYNSGTIRLMVTEGCNSGTIGLMVAKGMHREHTLVDCTQHAKLLAFVSCMRVDSRFGLSRFGRNTVEGPETSVSGSSCSGIPSPTDARSQRDLEVMKSCHDIASTISEEALESIREYYNIPEGYVFRAPLPEQWPYQPEPPR